MPDELEGLKPKDILSIYDPDSGDKLSGIAKKEYDMLIADGVTDLAKINLPTAGGAIRDAIIGIEDEKVILMVSPNLPNTVLDIFRSHIAKKYGLNKTNIEVRTFVTQKNSNEAESEDPQKSKIREHFKLLKSKISAYSKQDGILYKESSMKKEQEIANQVLLALANTVSNATEICLSKDGAEYLYSAEVFSALLEIIDILGNEQLDIKRSVELENKYKSNGESEVYLFRGENVQLSNGQVVEWLKILIRPNDLLGSESNGVQEVIAQARFKTQYKIKGTTGVANVRIDPPDPRFKNNIVIDLEIGDGKNNGRKNLINKLHLKQKAGHHFNSGVNISDFGELTPADIHRAIANRLIEVSTIQ